MKILIGADIVPTKSNFDSFKKGDARALVGEAFLEIINEADYRIFNLEVPLTNKETPIKKCGPALIAPTGAIKGYKALKVDCLTIANNHIMDQGVDGFNSTVNTLEQNGIDYIGGGSDISSAQKPRTIEIDGKRIGIYACAEREFSIASENAPGANPFDPLESPDHIFALKSECDFVVVLYHGGKEHYRYPSPNLQKRCRKMIQKGADLVVCQHSHCIGCEEKYENGTIVYGQGNFLFDYSDSEFWQTSMLVQVNDDFSITYIPLEKNGNAVRIAIGDKASEIINEFKSRSEEIKDPAVLETRYTEFAQKMISNYISALSGVNSKNIFLRAINKLSGYRYFKFLMKNKYDEKKRLTIRNFVECEAHSELLLRGLELNDN